MNVSKKLTISLIQANLVWENPEKNTNLLQKKIASISRVTDLIILPEMFSTGFTMNAAKVAETMTGKTPRWMQKMAKKHHAAIVGSIVIKEKETFYNRLLFVHPSGEINYYDKRHTFTLAKEDTVFSRGKEKLLVSYKGWKISPFICYDLRFPVWARNTENYDLLLYIANWPETRIMAWDTLLKARAIENMSYTIGVNRVGKDANDCTYPGHSSVYDYLGKELCKSKTKETVLEVILEKEKQEKIRKKFRFLNDKDTFVISR